MQSRIIAAVDSIEVLSSYSRCCDSCLERRVVVRRNGVKEEQVQYYHRAVGCQIVGGPVKSFAAIEWLQPGEGEATAAWRMLRKQYDVQLWDTEDFRFPAPTRLVRVVRSEEIVTQNHYRGKEKKAEQISQ